MKAIRVLGVVCGLLMVTPVAVSAETSQGLASGSIGQCPGYPVPPFASWTIDGVRYTLGNICHVYSGTVAGPVSGVQLNAIFPDGSRMGSGRETLTGSVAGRQGTADFSFTANRPCASCASQIHVWSESGTAGLEDLELDLTGVGVGPFTYSGTYSFGGE